jgi:hypothetical protein
MAVRLMFCSIDKSINLPYGIWGRRIVSQAEFRRNRLTMYFILYLRIVLKVLNIPNSAWLVLPSSPLRLKHLAHHTLYHSPVSGGQRLFMHQFDI